MIISVSNVLLSIYESITFLVLFLFFNQKKEFISNNKIKSLIFIILYTFVSCWPEHVVIPAIRIVIAIFITATLLAYLVQKPLFPSIISTVIIFLFFFTTEIIISTAAAFLLGTDLNSLMNDITSRLILGFIIKSVQLAVAVLLFKYGKEFSWLSEFKKTNSIFVILVIQSIVMSILIISLVFYSNHDYNIFFFNIFLIILYLFFPVMIYLDFKERERQQAAQLKAQAQEEYIRNIENIMSIIRREKHDFSNHLNIILAMCCLNKPDTIQKIKNYISRVSDKLESTYSFFNSGNDYVDSLLAVKSNLAFEQGIHLEVDFGASLEDLKVNDSDLTSIIGNIVDNAYDALAGIGDDVNKVVSISTYKEGADFYLSISNNGPVITQKDMGFIFRSGYTTKSVKKSEHGYGLHIVQQLVKENDGMITVNSTEEETEFLIKFNGRK